MEKSKGSKSQEEVVYERLFDVIIEQKLQPGVRLTEISLAEIFAVSRTVVRRALLRLSYEGVVDIKPNIGAIVTTTEPKDVPQYFEARRIAEGALIRRVAGKLTTYQEETMRAMVREENRYFLSGNRARGLRKSIDFHFYLADIANNKPLAEMGKKMIARTSLIVAQYNLSGSGGCACVDHSALVDVMVSGPADRAENMMHEHLQHIEDNLYFGKQSLETDLYRILEIDKP
ncbi:MAG: GntR family transcriptional regulator [Halothiobacillus sp.]